MCALYSRSCEFFFSVKFCIRIFPLPPPPARMLSVYRATDFTPLMFFHWIPLSWWLPFPTPISFPLSLFRIRNLLLPIVQASWFASIGGIQPGINVYTPLGRLNHPLICLSKFHCMSLFIDLQWQRRHKHKCIDENIYFSYTQNTINISIDHKCEIRSISFQSSLFSWLCVVNFGNLFVPKKKLCCIHIHFIISQLEDALPIWNKRRKKKQTSNPIVNVVIIYMHKNASHVLRFVDVVWLEVRLKV